MILLFILDEDQNTISAVYEKNYRRMLYVSSQMLGHERGEEALHDVFVRLMDKYEKNISELRDKPALFFVIVVRNHAVNLLRSERLEYMPLDEETVFVGDFEDQVIENDSEEELVRLIRSLNPLMREVLEYKYILGYSNKEIAEELKTTQTVVSSRIDRAKNALRKKLEERGDIGI